MKLRKRVRSSSPGYPSLRQAAGDRRWVGTAALGLATAAMVSGCTTRVHQEAEPVRSGGVIMMEPMRTGGVPPMPKPPAADPQPGAAYVVKQGDTLSGLALRYLGRAGRWREIAALNPGIDPDRIRIGQSLVLPADSRTQQNGVPHERP